MYIQFTYNTTEHAALPSLLLLAFIKSPDIWQFTVLLILLTSQHGPFLVRFCFDLNNDHPLNS